MRFRHLKISVQTSDGPYGTDIEFPNGLVVVWADNSMGKSTCVKAIIVALGLEATLTVKKSELPLPPALTSRLDSDTGEHVVLESEVFLEIENNDGERIVVQRTIKGKRNKDLITVFKGPALTSGQSFASEDFFVSRPGAATREAGFHHFLAKFLGWDLPLVQTYDGRENPLYLEYIFPYFIVEQTKGWSAIQPPLPTQFRVRDAHKRSVEFLLNLDAHKIALTRQEVEFKEKKIESEWTMHIRRIDDLLERDFGSVSALPRRPISSWPPVILPTLQVMVDYQSVPIQNRIDSNTANLQKLILKKTPLVGEQILKLQLELQQSEQLLTDKQVALAKLLELNETETNEVQRLQIRLVAIEEDIQHHKDVRTVRNLGSVQNSSLDQGNCPVCHQVVQDSLILVGFENIIMTLDESITFLQEQHRIFDMMLKNTQLVAESRQRQIQSTNNEITKLRNKIRSLNRTLVSDDRLPSEAAIQTKLELEHSIRGDKALTEKFRRIIAEFASLAEQWKLVMEIKEQLPKTDSTEDDKSKICKWQDILCEQLKIYGFKSVQVNQVTISPDTYKPEGEGFDLEASIRYSLENSISASDLIRTIWSYLNGLLELARIERTNHPGCIIFDEPRQQSTRDLSFAQLLARTSGARAHNQQVIFFTSENKARLKEHLRAIPHKLNDFEGRVLKKIDK